MAELRAGDGLRREDGGEAVVVGVEVRAVRVEVFNLEVGGVHDYLVSATWSGGVLVHNNVCDEAREIVAELPEELFQWGKCKECATAIVDAFRSKGISGEILHIDARGRDFIVSDLVNNGKPITRNGEHRAVQVGGMVFDNFLPQGVSVAEYFDTLWAMDGINVEREGF